MQFFLLPPITGNTQNKTNEAEIPQTEALPDAHDDEHSTSVFFCRTDGC